MLKAKSTVASFLKKKFDILAFSKKALIEYLNYAHDKYDIPTGIVMDYVAERVELNSANEFILFILTDSIDHIYNQGNLSNYFTEIEINQYSKEKYVEEKVTFPLKIRCLQVAPDQWIGSSDVDFLMKLRNAQLVNYNVNAQRTMQRVVRGEKTFYRIALNRTAIKQIRDSLHKGSYIPNTITLNISEENDAEVHYDPETGTLEIESLDHFDISDGYHRYISMCQERDVNPKFNYPIELRIIRFSDDKVKQFIFQEDQKTKMKKIDSASMNMNAPSNLVVERLNNDSLFDLKGMISRNEGNVNYPELSTVVDYFYFRTGAAYNNSQFKVINVEKELREGINGFVEYKEDLLTKKYDFTDLMMLIYGIINKKSPEQIYNLFEQKDKLDGRVFSSKVPRKGMLKEIEKIEEK